MLRIVKNIAQKLNPGAAKEKQVAAVQAAVKAREKIGAGQFGTVYALSDGLVQKELPIEYKNKVLMEANLQDVGARLGISPSIHAVATGPISAFGTTLPMETGLNPRVQGQIEMQDLRPTHASYHDYVQSNPAKAQAVDLKTHQQLAQLVLQNTNLSDRHPGNIMVNQVTGRPSQLDYGLATRINNDVEKIANLTLHVANGLGSAGLDEEGQIFMATVTDLLVNKQDPVNAMDVAKQGLAMLQKIKQPVILKPDYVVPDPPAGMMNPNVVIGDSDAQAVRDADQLIIDKLKKEFNSQSSAQWTDV